MTTCDKCGKEVCPTNDATIFEAILTLNNNVILVNQARHLLPEGNCPGSPSRAQYLEGQPRDPRYPYLEKNEIPYREAFKKLLEFPS